MRFFHFLRHNRIYDQFIKAKRELFRPFLALPQLPKVDSAGTSDGLQAIITDLSWITRPPLFTAQTVASMNVTITPGLEDEKHLTKRRAELGERWHYLIED